MNCVHALEKPKNAQLKEKKKVLPPSRKFLLLRQSVKILALPHPGCASLGNKGVYFIGFHFLQVGIKLLLYLHELGRVIGNPDSLV